MGFGIAHVKGEGCPVHPDELGGWESDEQYNRQLKAYYDRYPFMLEYADEFELAILKDN